MQRPSAPVIAFALAFAGVGACTLWMSERGGTASDDGASPVSAPSPQPSKSRHSESPVSAAPQPVPSPEPADDPRLPLQTRLDRNRARLLAGAPISGVAVILDRGNPVSRETSFVVGRTTRIELADHTIYEFTPSLNADGSVRYAIRERRPGGATSALPDLIQVPWEGFTLDAGDERILGFDPDGV